MYKKGQDHLVGTGDICEEINNALTGALSAILLKFTAVSVFLRQLFRIQYFVFTTEA